MSATTEVRHALAAALAGLPGVDVRPAAVTYAEARGLTSARYEATVLTGPAGDPDAEDQLDDLIAPEGVKATLEQDRTLGGLVADLNVSKCTGWQVYRRGEQQMLGATWTVDTQTL